MLLSYLGKRDEEWEVEDVAGRSRRERLSMGCHDFPLKVFPLTATKIVVVVVWQIVSQVKKHVFNRGTIQYLIYSETYSSTVLVSQVDDLVPPPSAHRIGGLVTSFSNTGTRAIFT